MTYVAPKIVASFSADAVLTEAAASGVAVAGTSKSSNATAAIIGSSVGAGGMVDLLSGGSF